MYREEILEELKFPEYREEVDSLLYEIYAPIQISKTPLKDLYDRLIEIEEYEILSKYFIPYFEDNDLLDEKGNISFVE